MLTEPNIEKPRRFASKYKLIKCKGCNKVDCTDCSAVTEAIQRLGDLERRGRNGNKHNIIS